MLQRQILQTKWACLLFIAALGYCLYVGKGGAWHKPSQKASGQGTNVMDISLGISREAVEPDSIVDVDELVPLDASIRMNRIRHEVIQIGGYNQSAKKLLNYRECSQFRSIDPSVVISGLPLSLEGPHGIPLDLQVGNLRGIRFECRPRYLGIYLITAYWTPAGELDDNLASNPVILIVRPPMDKQGRPVVKDEWLKNDPAP